MENISIKLRVANKGLTQVVDYVQGTNTIPIVFDIVDYNIPAGATANIYIKKPSGAQIYNSCTINENDVTVQPTTQMFAESGKQLGQLQILNGQKILESFLILFNVEKSIVDTTAAESTDEFTALEDALNSIDDSATEAKNAVSAANQAVSDAQTAIKNANTAISGANTAASSANSAAESATNAASAANTAAEGANTAAQNANEKASAANSAAEAANNAVDAIEEALQGTVINDNSVSNLTTYSSQKIEGEFDDVNEVIYEIGGRNLMLNSNRVNMLPFSSASLEIEGNVVVSEWGAQNAKRAHGSGGTSATFGLVIASRSINGKTTTFFTNPGDYTWSVYVKNNHSTNNIIWGRYDFSTYTKNGEKVTGPIELTPGESAVLSESCNLTVGNTNMQFQFRTIEPGDDFDVIYWNPKFEVGLNPTRWTPAPEDIQNEIDGKLSSTGDGSSLTVDFTESASVANITSGSTFEELFGQILKNQNDFLDSDTIQAAEDAGITGETGIALLNSVLQKTLINPIIEEYDSGGYHIRKYANGYMFATGSSSLGPTWTPVGASTGFATASKELTIPDMTEAVIGFTNLTQSSVYIFSPTIVVIEGKATLQSHRLSTSNASFTFNVAVLGKWK